MFREGLRPPNPFRDAPPLEAARTQDGMSLAALSRIAPVVVYCLPELSRRAVREAAEARAGVESAGRRLVLVHTEDDAEAARALAGSGLEYVARVADPERKLFAAFGLAEERRGLLRRKRLPAGRFLVVDGELITEN